MPQRAAHPCREPGCAELVQAGAWCTIHTPVVKHVDDRESASARGYDAHWRKLRAWFLTSNPICTDPFYMHGSRVVLATDVDHIIAKRDGGRDDVNNLQSLCHSCHSRKTRQGGAD